MSTWSFNTLLELTPEQIRSLLAKGVKFEVDAEELVEDPVMMLEVTVSTEDHGIGGYEFWGCKGYDRRICHDIESVKCEGIEVETTPEQDKILNDRVEHRTHEVRCEEPEYDEIED